MMDKEKVKAVANEAASKAKSAVSEIKANFKADEGTTGFRKVQSMFVNLWKSGATGKGALIACSGVLLLLLIIVFGGSGKSGENESMAAAARVQEETATAAARVQEKVAAVIACAQEEVAEQVAAREALARKRKQEAEREAKELAERAAKAESEIKDVESAEKALSAAYASGDAMAAMRVQKVLARLQAQEAAKKAEREAKEAAEREAKEKAEEEARLAKEKAEREAERAAFEAIPEKLVVKGLYAGMPGDSALEACKQLVAKEGDLVVVDYRNGIDREKDEETKAKEKKDWDARVKLAETDIDLFLKWNSLNGDVYNPAVKDCEGKIPDPHGFANALANKARTRADSQCHTRLKASGIGNLSVKVPDDVFMLASSMACFAAVYGYQVEWMLPGRHSGVENAKDSRPQIVSIETLKSADFVMLGGVRRIISMTKWEGNNEFNNVFGTQLYPKVYDKGLRICRILDLAYRDYRDRLLFRIIPQDSTGKPIEKSDLATEIACNFPDLFKKGSSNAEKVKEAEKYVDAVSEWVDVGYEYYHRISHNSRGANERQTNKTSRLIEDLFSVGGRTYEDLMYKLANNCKASVELGVLVEPVEKFEQITEVFTIPASDYEAASKFVSKMDVNLGKESEDAHGSDGSRKRVFFKHDLEDIRSPLWFRLVLKTTNGVEVAKDDVVKNWLAARGYYKPSERVKVPPKNLIQVSINQEGVPDNKLKGLCFVWTDESGNVKETYYTAEGMNRFFDAKDLSGEEFANLLVKNYPGLPSLKMNKKNPRRGHGTIEERTWTYSCPKGYQVKLFERSYINNNGVKYDSKMLERDPDKYLSISATKSAPARKFD